MKALVLTQKDAPLHYGDVPMPEAAEGEVLVQLHAAALNRRDWWITQGQYPGIVYPIILGSDGAGVADGREVIINPAFNWGDHPAFPSKSFQILGLPHPGTFAEWVSVPARQLYDKPAHLSMEQAAALPLAGLTAYRAVFTKGQLRAGDRVLVTGAGGGVALLAFQLAVAAGAQVWVTSGSDANIERTREMGGQGGANYREAEWSKQLQQQAGGFDLIIDSAAGDGFALLPKICNPGARIVTYGGTLGAVSGLSLQPVFWKQLSILGTTMGNDQEFSEMVQFVTQHRIVPVVDSVFPLSAGQAAFERIGKGGQFGKVVCSQLAG
ncbi:MAG: zinc-binding dehydrogenase [Saprospiraceae bacterium]|nr:zinc-binding dehydrogenase [Saprospiraceae bacterium]